PPAPPLFSSLYVTRRPPRSPLFPYTTLFRSQAFIGGPATGLYATATDLVRFAAALRDGSLVDDAYVQLFTTGKLAGTRDEIPVPDRKSTRLNSSHVKISYAVFCLKKKKKSNS